MAAVEALGANLTFGPSAVLIVGGGWSGEDRRDRLRCLPTTRQNRPNKTSTQDKKSS